MPHHVRYVLDAWRVNIDSTEVIPDGKENNACKNLTFVPASMGHLIKTLNRPYLRRVCRITLPHTVPRLSMPSDNITVMHCSTLRGYADADIPAQITDAVCFSELICRGTGGVRSGPGNHIPARPFLRPLQQGSSSAPPVRRLCALRRHPDAAPCQLGITDTRSGRRCRKDPCMCIIGRFLLLVLRLPSQCPRSASSIWDWSWKKQDGLYSLMESES